MKTSTVYSIAEALDYHNFYCEGFGSVSTVYDYGQLCWDIWELNSVDREFHLSIHLQKNSAVTALIVKALEVLRWCILYILFLSRSLFNSYLVLFLAASFRRC